MHFLRRRHLPATVWAAQLQPLFGRLLLFIHGLIIYQWSVQCRPLQPHGLHGLLAVCGWPLFFDWFRILCNLWCRCVLWVWGGGLYRLQCWQVPGEHRCGELH